MVFAYFRQFPHCSPRLLDFNHGAAVAELWVGQTDADDHHRFSFSLILMNKLTVVFDPYAAVHRDIVQAIVDKYCVASTGKAEWYPVAFFLRDENGEVLGGLLGDIWAAWLHVRTLAVAAPVLGHGFGKELMKRAETYAIARLHRCIPRHLQF
jgi:GNAT superfamily N-acetyltransferase